MFLDTWKRPEELVLNSPDVPMVTTVAPPPPAEPTGGKEGKGDKGAAKNAPAVLSRDLEGSLQAGHRTFEWLQAVFVMVISAQVRESLLAGGGGGRAVHSNSKVLLGDVVMKAVYFCCSGILTLTTAPTACHGSSQFLVWADGCCRVPVGRVCVCALVGAAAGG
jgi:hypothetical protein